jgi:hypothetical protein
LEDSLLPEIEVHFLNFKNFPDGLFAEYVKFFPLVKSPLIFVDEISEIVQEEFVKMMTLASKLSCPFGSTVSFPQALGLRST